MERAPATAAGRPGPCRTGLHGKDAMTAPAAPLRPRSAALLPVALVAAALVWAFWTTLADLVQTWNTNPQYSHGFLVPLFAAYLLWARRDRLPAAFQPSLWGVPLLALGLALRLFG